MVITRQDIDELHAAAAAALDAQAFEDWLALFAEDSAYTVISKENADAGSDLALVRCRNRAMIRDRILAIRTTLYHLPRVQRRIQSGLRVVRADATTASCEASFAVFETMPGQPPTVFATGRYVDEVCRDGSTLLFHRRSCVLDADVIVSSMPFPL